MLNIHTISFTSRPFNVACWHSIHVSFHLFVLAMDDMLVRRVVHGINQMY